MVLSTAIAEVVLFVSSVMLNLFVIPTLLDKESAVPRWQSIPSAIALALVAVAYFSLGLFWPMVSVVAGAILWVLVAVYRSS